MVCVSPLSPLGSRKVLWLPLGWLYKLDVSADLPLWGSLGPWLRGGMGLTRLLLSGDAAIVSLSVCSFFARVLIYYCCVWFIIFIKLACLHVGCFRAAARFGFIVSSKLPPRCAGAGGRQRLLVAALLSRSFVIRLFLVHVLAEDVDVVEMCDLVGDSQHSHGSVAGPVSIAFSGHLR